MPFPITPQTTAAADAAITSRRSVRAFLDTPVPRDTRPPWKVETTGATHDPDATGLPVSAVTPSREIEARSGPFSVRSWSVW